MKRDAAALLEQDIGDGLHHHALTDGGHAVVKHRQSAPAGFFAAEVHGLDLLRAHGRLRIPEVLAYGSKGIVLEDLGRGHASTRQWEQAGQRLADMHAHHAGAFGLDRDGWCGDSAQSNQPTDDGHRFFAEQRLLSQTRRARDSGLLSAADSLAVEHLCARLPELIPAQAASLVHGDLWTANLHACADGELALIDAAAVHFGWAETDLAMLTLFGEPPATFFDAYGATSGSGTDWRLRVPIYNLYHLLNHLNLFGGCYLPAVQKVLRAC